MLLPSSGLKNIAGFIDNHHAYTNGQQYKPLTYSLKIEVACSVDKFERITQTARYQDTGENFLNKNKLISIGNLKSLSETVSPHTDTQY